MTDAVLISNGRLIDPASGTDSVRDVLIANGLVSSIAESIEPPPGARVIDATARVVAPAFVEIHAHLREPGGEASETIASGCAAAARGGYARVFAMPNTTPVCDSPMGVRYLIDRAREAGPVRVHPVGSVTTGMSGERLTDFHALLEAGAGALSDDGLPVADAGMMRLALQCAADLGCVILDHCEDMSLTGPGVMHEGPWGMALGLPGIPRSSEASIVLRDGLLALETGGRLHICHVSTRDSVEALRWLKSRGAPITAEVSPHHLTLTDARVGSFDTHAKMKPPLCEESDRTALIDALEDGTIDCIATDHAPHAPILKDAPFEHAPFGIIGMESAFGVLHDAFVRSQRWTLSFLIEKMALAPARVMDRPWSRLSVGEPADLVVLDITTPFTFDAASLGSKSRNCPWLGHRLVGRPDVTILGGEIAWDRATFDGRDANPYTAR